MKFYVGFVSLDEILSLKDKNRVKQYAQEAEARLCSSYVVRSIWNRYFELCNIKYK